jgi:hypothetical protein
MGLNLAEQLTLPPDAASEVWAFLGRRGSGKTYAAGRLVEELVDVGHQVVILDPVGTHWGLRLAKDGHGPGLPIPVFGGQHGDIPLQPGAGAVVARLVAEQGGSLVLDVSEFSGAEQRRFVADFATELLQAKKRRKSALMVVWEEAQEFAPQRASADVARMLGAVEKLIKLGRNFGIGTALVTQRPQAVNKDVLNQAEFLVALQMTGPQERKTIDGWVQEKGAERSIGNELPSLPVGEALIWGPRLGVFGRYRILPKRTYDASSTPGAAPIRATELAAIDLEAVSAAMAETIEKAKADDPRELRRQLTEWKTRAERAVVTAERATEDAAQATALYEAARRRAETPVLRDEDRERLTGVVEAMEMMRARLDEAIEAFQETRSHVASLVGEVASAADRSNSVRRQPYGESVGRRDEQQSPRGQRPSGPPVAVVANVPEESGTAFSPASSSRPLPKAERAVLSVLAQYPVGRTATQVALLTGYSSKGGGFNNALSALRRQGYMEGGKANLRITPAGLASGIDWEPLPTGSALVDHWLRQLRKAERAILAVLVDVYPAGLLKAEVGERTGYEPTGGGFNNALSRLRTLELIDRGTDLRASGDLMEAVRN